MSERVERLAFEIAVSPALHVIALVWSELTVILVECQRKLAGRVYITIEYVGNRCSSLLTEVPSLDYSLRIGCLIGECYCTTGKVYENNFLASLLKSLDQILLHLRKLDCLSVATAEARDSHRHIFSFKTRCDTTCEDDSLITFCFLDECVIIKCCIFRIVLNSHCNFTYDV